MAKETDVATPATVDAYLADLPDTQRATLEQLRGVIRAAAPEAVETIAYAMPAYRVEGRILVTFAGFKQHTSLFPASGAVMEALGGRLAPYFSGRGTLRFPAGEPLPADLVTQIVRVRLAEIGAGDGRRVAADSG